MNSRKLAKTHDGKRRSDALPRWSQFISLALGHLGKRYSLRDIEAALASNPKLHYDLGARSLKHFARTMRIHRELVLNFFRARKRFSSGVVGGLNNKAKLVTMRKSYGFRTFRSTEITFYHALGKLPEPKLAHSFY